MLTFVLSEPLEGSLIILTHEVRTWAGARGQQFTSGDAVLPPVWDGLDCSHHVCIFLGVHYSPRLADTTAASA